MQSVALLKESDTSVSSSKVYLKHKEYIRLRKALVSHSTRRKLMNKSNWHARYNGQFERLYNTSPHRKIQKLREARQFNPDSNRSSDKILNRNQAISENSPDLLELACKQCVEKKSKNKHINSSHRKSTDKTFHSIIGAENFEDLHIKKTQGRLSNRVSIFSKITRRKL